MPLPASLIASIVSAIIETISSSPDVSTAQYDSYVAKRTLPPEAKMGLMQPPPGNGSIVIDNQSLTLSPLAQFRNEKNMVVMPMSLQQPSNVVYIYDQFGAVRRVWLISQTEAESIKAN
ncbi:hypothetical protein FACS1894158_08270 [Betaproteobacteria bacterium]|nr:hypothetical protein FACS1894158_08270 [Betaproteobacteria bacterium]